MWIFFIFKLGILSICGFVLGITQSHYQFLFDIVELKYSDLKIQSTEREYLEVLNKAINRNFSMEEFKSDENEILKNEFAFEDVLVLEYCLMFERKIKNK